MVKQILWDSLISRVHHFVQHFIRGADAIRFILAGPSLAH
jgi:hypothetical protein